jgi:hypothetical protein
VDGCINPFSKSADLTLELSQLDGREAADATPGWGTGTREEGNLVGFRAVRRRPTGWAKIEA